MGILTAQGSSSYICWHKSEIWHHIPHNNSWTEIKVLPHNVQQLHLVLLGRPIVEDGDRERVGNSNSIGYLKTVYKQGLCSHIKNLSWNILKNQTALRIHCTKVVQCLMFYSKLKMFRIYISICIFKKKTIITTMKSMRTRDMYI